MSLEITSIKPSQNNPNVGQSQLAGSSITPESSESGVVEGLPTGSNESNQRVGVENNLRSQSEVLNNVSLSVSAQEHQEMSLARLREKIDTKKREFELLVQGPEGTEEEKMDLERAKRRFDKLLELPQSEIIREYKGIFNMYFEPLNNLLDLDARTLNLVLATTYVPSPFALNYEVNVKEGVPQTYDDFLRSMIHYLPSWDFITHNFSVDPNDYFYLPGFPIVVQRTVRRDALLHLIVDSGAEINNERLTRQEEEKIIEMAKHIKRSNWQEHRVESLKESESLTFVNVASFAGKASKPGHPIIKIDDSTTPLELGDRVIHEDYHHHMNMLKESTGIGIYETDNFQDTSCHKHSWATSGRCSSLLSECFTYNAESDFRMLLLEKGDLTQDEKIESIEVLCNLRDEAEQAFEELNKNIERLNSDGKRWLADAQERWETLGGRFEKYINENVDLLLSAKDFSSRECGYKAIDHMWTHSPRYREECYRKYTSAIQDELNCYVVLDQSSKQSRPYELQQVAAKRLAEDDIFRSLCESLSENLTKEDNESRSYTYDCLFRAWNIGNERRVELSDLFIQSLKREANSGFLGKLLESGSIPDEFKSLVISQREGIVKPN